MNGIGADYKVLVRSVDGIVPFYIAELVTPDGTHVPLASVGSPFAPALLATSGHLGGAGRLDTAPNTAITATIH